jgi:hypothetical protein
MTAVQRPFPDSGGGLSLAARRLDRVMLDGMRSVKLVVQFEEGGDSTSVERDDLLAVLSNGEKKAL